MGENATRDPVPRGVQFAVVREDAQVELDLLRGIEARRALLVCSGGCTVLALRAHRPEIELTVVDPNGAQIALLEGKVAAASEGDAARRRRRLNIDDPNPLGLSQNGNFEGLFRILRQHLVEFVRPASGWGSVLRGDGDGAALVRGLRRDPHWAAAFSSCFADPLLHAMFGTDATRHAQPGSYPKWFQGAFERLLSRRDAASNPFLHHVLRGCYAEGRAEPLWLRGAPDVDLKGVTLHQQEMCDVEDFGPFDFVNLSNVLDWMDREHGAQLVSRLCAELRPGAMVLNRRLNNDVDPFAASQKWLRGDEARDRRLLELDRSGFYGAVSARTRTEAAVAPNDPPQPPTEDPA